MSSSSITSSSERLFLYRTSHNAQVIPESHGPSLTSPSIFGTRSRSASDGQRLLHRHLEIKAALHGKRPVLFNALTCLVDLFPHHSFVKRHYSTSSKLNFKPV